MRNANAVKRTIYRPPFARKKVHPMIYRAVPNRHGKVRVLAPAEILAFCATRPGYNYIGT